MTSKILILSLVLFVPLAANCSAANYVNVPIGEDYSGMSHYQGGCLWDTYCCERESICENYYRSLSQFRRVYNAFGRLSLDDGCQSSGCGGSCGRCNCGGSTRPTTQPLPVAKETSASYDAESVIVQPQSKTTSRQQPEDSPELTTKSSVVEPPHNADPTDRDDPPAPLEFPDVELPKNPLPELPKNDLPTTRHRHSLPIHHVGIPLKVNATTNIGILDNSPIPGHRHIIDRGSKRTRTLGRWRSQSVPGQ